MNKRDYIQSRLEKILKENINEKADAILQRLNYKKEAPFNPEGSAFDYVQEEEGGECSECGGEMREGECSECGYMKEDLNELGGMDDGHPRFGHKNLSKLSKDELDAILNGVEFSCRIRAEFVSNSCRIRVEIVPNPCRIRAEFVSNVSN